MEGYGENVVLITIGRGPPVPLLNRRRNPQRRFFRRRHFLTIRLF